MKIIERIKKVANRAKWLWSNRKSVLLLFAAFIIGFSLIFIAAFNFSGVPLVFCLIVGGVLVLGSWIKAEFEAYVKRSIRLHEAEKLMEENRRLLERESILNQQLEEARNRKLQVLNVQPILNLGILEADCEIAKCFDFFIDKNGEIITDESSEEPAGFIGSFLEGVFGKGSTRFIGTRIVKFKANYGVKLQNVRVRRDDKNKAVYVEGVKPTYTGSTGFPQSHWEGCVVLSERGDDEWVMDDKALKLESPCKDMCSDYMEESLQNGPEQLEWLKQPLQDTVEHLLQMMIVPVGYSLHFVEKIEEKTVPFFEYAAELGLGKPRLGSGID